MIHYRSKDEQLRLGEQAVELRDEERLKWRVIAEKLALYNISQTIGYYKKYKEAEKLSKKRMNPEQIEEFSCKHKIEPGWVWLYENGFKRRVPVDVQEKIEDAKLRDC